MIHLLPLMLERMGIIFIVAFLLSRVKSFNRIINNDQRISGKILLIAVFGIFGVMSNYTGIEINPNAAAEHTWLLEVEPDSAIANTRILGIGIGALLGGPFVGLGIGLIAGLHRFTLGGFTAAACAISAILAGLAAGYIGEQYRQRFSITPLFAVSVGVLWKSFKWVLSCW